MSITDDKIDVFENIKGRMNCYQKFCYDLQKYLSSKCPDIPDHTVMEISAYISYRSSILVSDALTNYARQISYGRRSFRNIPQTVEKGE